MSELPEAISDLAHALARPYTSPEVDLAMQVGTQQLARLSAAELADHVPALLEGLCNRVRVTGGHDDRLGALIAAIDRADLARLIHTTEAWLATRADRQLLLKRFEALLPSTARWPNELFEYLVPSADADDRGGRVEAEPSPELPVQTYGKAGPARLCARVLDRQGAPVSYFGYSISRGLTCGPPRDESGDHLELSLPPGRVTLRISVRDAAREIVCKLEPGGTTDLGVIRIG